MLIAEAQVRTDRASRYLVQLCKHLNTKGKHVGFRRRFHSMPDGEQRGPVDARVEWTETEGLVALSWGRCAMQAETDRLIFRAEAGDEAGLQRIQDLVGGMLVRFGRRSNLEVTWRRSESSHI
ncbi:MAG TPA: DUF2218 domain-containing protein [Actinoplanes sp.]|nr:DUF2218 domain-containing protein [Actinoplanes sp.]